MERRVVRVELAPLHGLGRHRVLDLVEGRDRQRTLTWLNVLDIAGGRCDCGDPRRRERVPLHRRLIVELVDDRNRERIERPREHIGVPPLGHAWEQRRPLVEEVPAHRHGHRRELHRVHRHGLGSRRAQASAKLRCGGWALIRVARERGEHHVVQSVGHRREGARRGEVSTLDPLDDLCIALALKEAPHGQHLPEHDRQRVHVGAPVDLGAQELLGRHVAELALEASRRVVRDVQSVSRLRDTEVDHLHLTERAEEHVLRTHVAMDDVQETSVVPSGLVRRLEPRSGVGRDAHRGGDGEASTTVGQARQELGEGHAVDVLHDEVVGAPRLAELLDAHHVRVLDAGRDPPLVEEHPDEVLVRGEVRLDRLDHHVTTEAPRSAARAQEEVRHPSRTELPDDLVRTQRRPHGDHEATLPAFRRGNPGVRSTSCAGRT